MVYTGHFQISSWEKSVEKDLGIGERSLNSQVGGASYPLHESESTLSSELGAGDKRILVLTGQLA